MEVLAAYVSFVDHHVGLLVQLLEDADLRTTIARQARAHVEQNFSCERAARAFENACADAVDPG